VGDQDPSFQQGRDGDGRRFKARGVPIQADIIKGHDHNYYAVSSRCERAAWAFLRGHSLDGDPKYIEHLIR